MKRTVIAIVDNVAVIVAVIDTITATAIIAIVVDIATVTITHTTHTAGTTRTNSIIVTVVDAIPVSGSEFYKTTISSSNQILAGICMKIIQSLIQTRNVVICRVTYNIEADGTE